MRKVFKIFFEGAVFIFVLGIWLYSFYKIIDYLKLNKFSKIKNIWGIERLFPICPPPEPPCPPGCCPTPTPTPTSIIPTPTPTSELLPTLTSTPTPTIIPAPTATSVPTSPPSEGEVGEGVGGLPEAPHCGAQTPPAPNLKSATAVKTDEVKLVWDAVEPVTHYSISYGFSSGNYLYGVPNTGKVTSFMVGELSGGNYCFAVRAVNDCAASGLSNEICTGAVLGVTTGKVLGVSTLGATGGLMDDLFLILFTLGSVCLSLGLKIYLPAPKGV